MLECKISETLFFLLLFFRLYHLSAFVKMFLFLFDMFESCVCLAVPSLSSAAGTSECWDEFLRAL